MNLTLTTLKALSVAALLVVATPAFAATNKSCNTSQRIDSAFVSGFTVAKPVDQTRMIANFAKGNKNGIACLLQNTKGTNPKLAKTLMNKFITLLAKDKKNTALIARLTEANADLLALKDNTSVEQIEPASNKLDSEKQTFATQEEETNSGQLQSENFNQLNDPTKQKPNSPSSN